MIKQTVQLEAVRFYAEHATEFAEWAFPGQTVDISPSPTAGFTVFKTPSGMMAVPEGFWVLKDGASMTIIRDDQMSQMYG